MRLDNETRRRILETVILTTLADEEFLRGDPTLNASTSTLAERAMRRYEGQSWTEGQLGYLLNDFRTRVQRTVAMIFQAIEDPKDRAAEDRQSAIAEIARLGQAPR